jgi:eukaryotic-like serine/threonine-protein kinase
VTGVVADVPAGYRAGSWEVTSRIGSGSWASVYEARRTRPPASPDDPPEGATAALKFLPGGTLSPPQYADLREAVAQEVRFNEQAGHPRLVRTYEIFVVDDPQAPALHGAVVLAMERAATSLQDVLDAVTPPGPAPDAARVIGEICEGLVHIHASGWVHGDLKPANVLLMQDRSVRLADFGLARELDGTHAYSPRLGSPDYLPPEWWTERIGAQGIATRTTADLWALGVTAHQLLTGGMLPFPGATARARMAAAQAYAGGRAQLRLADEVPPAWRPAIADCLAPDHASRRAHSAASLLPRIEALRVAESPPSRGRGARGRLGRQGWPGRRGRLGRLPRAEAGAGGSWSSRRVRLAVAAPVVAAVIAGGALAAGGGRGSAPHTAVVRVFDAEVQCQHSLLASCRLGLAGDPRATYGASNVIGHTRHGNTLVAECYIPDGTTVRSETGASSARWYRVRTASGTAWLPGVRAWPGSTPAVGRCAAS